MPENTKSSPEPSMEEIIASISRIITEDKTSIEPTHSTAEEKPDILELTEALNEDGSVRHIGASNEAASSVPTEPAAAHEPSIAATTTPVQAEPPHRGSGIEPKLDPRRERIVSAATSEAAAAAFAQLGALPREKRREGELSFAGGDRTLEDIVRDLLRPLLEAWLNEHLPDIVERLVRQEIARVVGEAGLR
jgi:cell pole-organizing protein PopZ